MVVIIVGIIILILILISFIIIPIKIEINANLLPTVDKNKSNIKNENNKKNKDKCKHYIKFIILGCIPIVKINLDKNNKRNSKNKNNKNKIIETISKVFSYFIYSEKLNKVLFTRKDFKRLNNSIYFHKINLNLGINLKEQIINAYLITIINILISSYISANIDRFDLKETQYYTYISKEIYNLKIYCIISFKLVNTIDILIKAMYNYRKVEKKNVTRTTSNRKSYDDSNDISREYDRC